MITWLTIDSYYFLDPDTASDLVYHTYMINRIFLKLELLYVKIKTFKNSLHFRVPIILTFTVPVVHLSTEEIISVLRSRIFLFALGVYFRLHYIDAMMRVPISRIDILLLYCSAAYILLLWYDISHIFMVNCRMRLHNTGRKKCKFFLFTVLYEH